MEVLWKLMEAIIVTRIKKVVTLHDVLHGFCAGRGSWTAIIEPNIAQDLDRVDPDTLFFVFLDLRKANDNLDRGWILNTLEEFWVGPTIQGMLAEFWARKEVVTQYNRYHGP